MKNIVSLFCALMLFSCEKESEIFTIVNLNRNYITVLGHGGMGISSVYPINSFESIMSCLSLGTDGSEIDVQMTKDSVLVAFHDSDLDAKTNLSGVISQYNFDEIKDGFYDETPYKTYAIVSLDQLFANIENLNAYKFTFDCKLYNADTSNDAYLPTFANAVVKIAQKYNMQRRLMIEANDKNFLTLLAEKNKQLKLFIYPQSFEEGLETATELGLYGITISNEDITPEQLQVAHSQGFRVAVWNVHTEDENMDAIRKNPDFIQTDKVKYLVETMSATDDAFAEKLATKQWNKVDSLSRKTTDSTSKFIKVNKTTILSK